MRGVLGLGIVWAATLAVATPAAALVQVDVDLGAQRIHVVSTTGTSYDWPISSGAYGRETPRGVFSPKAMFKMTHSFPKYDNEPMPFTIVFQGYFAIHGTREVDWLGHAVSHGCVRLAPENAETLFSLVQHEGATIHIDGVAPIEPPPLLVHELSNAANDSGVSVVAQKAPEPLKRARFAKSRYPLYRRSL